jgi:hypothetical protein
MKSYISFPKELKSIIPLKKVIKKNYLEVRKLYPNNA